MCAPRRCLRLACLALLRLTISLADEQDVAEKSARVHDDPSDEVLSLNRFTFNGNVLRSEDTPVVAHWMVLFCPSWWEQCQEVAPVFAGFGSNAQVKLNTALLRQSVRFAQVDCARDKPLCNEQGVEGYPYIIHYHRGERAAVWEGGSLKGIPKWLRAELRGILASETAKAAQSDIKALALRYLKPGDVALDLFLVLAAMALSLRMASTGPEVRQKAFHPVAQPHSSHDGVVTARAAHVVPQGELADPMRLADVLPDTWRTQRGRVEL